MLTNSTDWIAHHEVQVTDSACTGCGVCVELCPPDVLRISSDRKAYPAYPDECQACFVCVDACAYQAIAVAIRLNPPAWEDFLSWQAAGQTES